MGDWGRRGFRKGGRGGRGEVDGVVCWEMNKWIARDELINCFTLSRWKNFSSLSSTLPSLLLLSPFLTYFNSRMRLPVSSPCLPSFLQHLAFNFAPIPRADESTLGEVDYIFLMMAGDVWSWLVSLSGASPPSCLKMRR